jgi:hypothetical protein
MLVNVVLTAAQTISAIYFTGTVVRTHHDICDWNSFAVRLNAVGQERAVFDNLTSPTTLEKFEVHVMHRSST